MAVSDCLGLILAAAIASTFATGADVETLLWIAAFSPVWVLVIKLHRLYDNDHKRIRHSTLDEAPGLISACAIGMVALNGLLSISPAGALAGASAVALGFCVLFTISALRAILRGSWHNLIGPSTGIVVGSGAAAAIFARRVAVHPEARLNLAGYLVCNGEGSSNGGAPPDPLPRLGTIHDVERVAHEFDIERVIVTEQGLNELETGDLIEECKAAGVGLTLLPRNYSLFGPGIELNRLAELPVLDFRFSDPSRSTQVLKRGIDVAVSASLLILLLPLLLIVAALIKLDSRGPALFKQTRAGRDGQLFTMLKFRTMDEGAETRLGELIDLDSLDQPAFKIRNDPRVTRVGRYLRRLSLDELPQFFNVLRGNMSLVGPRPEEEAVVLLYDERQRARLAVKPGLTGPMQVYGRGNLTFEERLSLERDYLDNLSVAGDIAILMRTPAALIRGDGAY